MRKEIKKAPSIRFRGFTDDWEQRKLGDIIDSYSGGTPSVGNTAYYGGNIPFIRSAEIDNESTELFLTEDGLSNSSAKMVSKGDILYALYGATSGEVGIAKLDGAINQAILAILPHEGYDAQFIMQRLKRSKASIISTYLQGGQGNLSGTIVKNLIINTPSYVEQVRMGEYFFDLDNLITLHQRKLDQLKTLKKYFLQNMFPAKGEKVPRIRFKGFTGDWEWHKLSDLSTLNGRIGFRGYTKKDIISKEEGGFLTLSPTNIIESQLILGDKNTYITKEKYEESPEIQIRNGDILFVKTGSTLGKSCLVNGLFEPASINPQIVVIRTDKHFKSFLAVQFTSDLIQEQVVAIKIGGAVPTMTEMQIKNFDIVIPSNTKEAEIIGTIFSRFDKIISLQQQRIEEFQILKKYMLQNMFI